MYHTGSYIILHDSYRFVNKWFKQLHTNMDFKNSEPIYNKTPYTNLDYESMIISDLTRHDNISIGLLNKALSGLHSDMVDAILFCLFKPLDIMDIPNCYSMIHDINTSDLYLWNPNTLLWNRYDSSVQTHHPKIKSFNYIIEKYVNIINELTIQTQEPNSNLIINSINAVICKLKTRSYKENVWKELLEHIQLNFSDSRDKVNTKLPLNDGFLFDIFTHERRLRSPRDLYTFTLRAHIDNSITTIKPTDDSPESHHIIWKFFNQLMSENEEMTIFLITTLAIYISGDVKDQSFMIIIGESNNGKSVLLSLMQWLLNDSAYPGAHGIFIDNGSI